MTKKGITKTDPLNMIKRIPKIVLIVGLLALIGLSVFNKSIIETLENKKNTKKNTQGAPNTNQKKKFMEVIIWLDYSMNTHFTTFALDDWMKFETIYKNNAQVIIEKRDMNGVTTWLNTIPEYVKKFAEAKKQNPKLEEEQLAFIKALSPYVTFTILDKTKGETASSGATRTIAGAIGNVKGQVLNFHNLDATFKALMGLHRINVEP